MFVSNARVDRDPVARYLLMGSAALLAMVGLLMIYSASSVAELLEVGDTAYHLKRQGAFLLIGLAAAFVLSRIDYRRLRPLVRPALIGADLLLGAVLVLGMSKWGAQRWINIGPVPVQPSEIAKLCVVAAVALGLAQSPPHRRTFTGLGTQLALVVIPAAGLIMLQPDMGTTMSMIIAVLFVLWIGDFDRRSLAMTVLAVGTAVPIAIMAAPYRFQRFTAFLHPWADRKGQGYQIIQAMYAFGSGGLQGVGLGLSRQKFFYLPAAHTDFIFAIVGEELGLIGTLLVVAAFAVFAYAGLRIASRTPDRFGRLLAGGIVVMVATQAALNMLAVTGMMPITGIPMPFVSYGGSSMILNLACLGVIMSVCRFGDLSVKRKTTAKPVRPEENVIEGPAEWRRYGGSHLSSVDGGRRAAR
jgi:cell division protein FtsW